MGKIITYPSNCCRFRMSNSGAESYRPFIWLSISTNICAARRAKRSQPVLFVCMLYSDAVSDALRVIHLPKNAHRNTADQDKTRQDKTKTRSYLNSLEYDQKHLQSCRRRWKLKRRDQVFRERCRGDGSLEWVEGDPRFNF